MFPREGKFIKAFLEKKKTRENNAKRDKKEGIKNDILLYSFSDIKETFLAPSLHFLLLIPFKLPFIFEKYKKGEYYHYRCNPPANSLFIRFP
jgi:hypothetical protein